MALLDKCTETLALSRQLIFSIKAAKAKILLLKKISRIWPQVSNAFNCLVLLLNVEQQRKMASFKGCSLTASLLFSARSPMLINCYSTEDLNSQTSTDMMLMVPTDVIKSIKMQQSVRNAHAAANTLL